MITEGKVLAKVCVKIRLEQSMMGWLKQVQFWRKNHGNCGKIAIFVAKIGKFVAKIVCMQKLYMSLQACSNNLIWPLITSPEKLRASKIAFSKITKQIAFDNIWQLSSDLRLFLRQSSHSLDISYQQP